MNYDDKQKNATPLSGSGNLESIISMFESPQVQNNIVDDFGSNQPLVSKDTRDAALAGGRSGGLSGALMGGGVSSMLGEGGLAAGGPYALAGGLILSQIEAKQAEDAQKQAQYEQDIRSQKDDLLGLARERARQVYKV